MNSPEEPHYARSIAERAEGPAWKAVALQKFRTADQIARQFIGEAAPEYGEVRNFPLVGKLLYYMLFKPKEFPEEYQKAVKSNQETVIQQEIPHNGSFPEEGEFAKKFSHVLTTEIPHQLALFDGSKEAITDMAEHGPVIIWTKGDVLGIPELELRGSHDQTKKIINSGFKDLQDSLHTDQKELFFIAAENKVHYLKELIPKVAEYDIKHIVVVDDRVENLLEVRALAEEGGLSDRVTLVWDREREVHFPDSPPRIPGGYAGTAEEAIQEFGLVTVDSVRSVTETLHELLQTGEKTAWLIDFDDVLVNSAKTTELQEESLGNWLELSGWFEETPA